MANRDDFRGNRGGAPRRGRNDWGPQEDGSGRHSNEQRSFGPQAGRHEPPGGRGEGEMEPWRRERYGSRFDQDRVNYGSGYDRERGGYGRSVYDEPSQKGGNRGHESGFSARPEGGRRGQGSYNPHREQWREAGGAPYGDLELNPRDPGIQEFGAPHDYAYHPPQGHEFDPDYTRWRDQQLASHDRDYQEWRRHQQEQYDQEYRTFRAQRRDQFGASFQQWRDQRSGSEKAPGAGEASQSGQPPHERSEGES
jgi:hypothetical protein